VIYHFRCTKEIFPKHHEENGMNNIKMADNAETGK